MYFFPMFASISPNGSEAAAAVSRNAGQGDPSFASNSLNFLLIFVSQSLPLPAIHKLSILQSGTASLYTVPAE